ERKHLMTNRSYVLKYISDEDFIAAVKNSKSKNDLFKKLGYKSYSSNSLKGVEKRAEKLGVKLYLDQHKISTRLYSVSNEKFKEIIENNTVLTEVLEELGYSRNNGSMRKYIRKRAEELGLNMEHYNGYNYKRKNKKRKIDYDYIFVENSKYSNNTRVKQ